MASYSMSGKICGMSRWLVLALPAAFPAGGYGLATVVKAPRMFDSRTGVIATPGQDGRQYATLDRGREARRGKHREGKGRSDRRRAQREEVDRSLVCLTLPSQRAGDLE